MIIHKNLRWEERLSIRVWDNIWGDLRWSLMIIYVGLIASSIGVLNYLSVTHLSFQLCTSASTHGSTLILDLTCSYLYTVSILLLSLIRTLRYWTPSPCILCCRLGPPGTENLHFLWAALITITLKVLTLIQTCIRIWVCVIGLCSFHLTWLYSMLKCYRCCIAFIHLLYFEVWTIILILNSL